MLPVWMFQEGTLASFNAVKDLLAANEQLYVAMWTINTYNRCATHHEMPATWRQYSS